MPLRISREPMSFLADYARVSIAFEVRSVFDVAVEDDVPPRFVLTERRLAVPWIKDYDAIDGEGPVAWGERFDLSNWGMLGAYLDGRHVGGAVIAWGSAEVDMLEGRDDLAVLWDIRAMPELRGGGIGSALFGAAERWAAARGCRQLKVETQNINVPACRFYAGRGCALRRIDRSAYPDLPDEIQLLWYKDLTH